MASWVALEDIFHGSGELEYYPGSHKLTYEGLDAQNSIVISQGSAEAQKSHVKNMWDQVAKAGLTKRAFAPKQGQALVWHANLIHGGGQTDGGANSTKTRKSSVTHYDLLRKHNKDKQMKKDTVSNLLRYNYRYAFFDRA